MSGVAVVGWVCDINGRYPDEAKVARIIEWPTPQNIHDIRSFLGLAVYFRVLVEGFAIIARPLYILLKGGALFLWRDEQQESFDELKKILSLFPTVLPIDYSFKPLILIVAVDTSKDR